MEDNESLQLIIDSLKEIENYKSNIHLDFRLEDLVPIDIPRYFAYHGSFTTPCIYQKYIFF